MRKTRTVLTLVIKAGFKTSGERERGKWSPIAGAGKKRMRKEDGVPAAGGGILRSAREDR